MLTAEPRAVLWDMDGTVIDSGDLHFLAWETTAREEGFSYTRDQHVSTFGMRNDTILQTLHNPDISPTEIVRIGDTKEQRYREHVAKQGIALLPGVRAWLAALQAAGWRMAVASSAPHANLAAIMSVTGIAPYFQAIASGDDVPQGKPNPDIFLYAADKLGVPPVRCIVVEDAVAGIEGARRAGMRCIGVGPNHRNLPADVAVERLDQLAQDAFERLVGL